MRRTIVPLVLIAFASSAAAQSVQHSAQAVTESVKASGHMSKGAAHSIVASGQVVSAAVAVPLSVGGVVLGSAASASVGAAHQSMKAASTPVGGPLPVTEETIVTTPPDVALQK